MDALSKARSSRNSFEMFLFISWKTSWDEWYHTRNCLAISLAQTLETETAVCSSRNMHNKWFYVTIQLTTWHKITNVLKIVSTLLYIYYGGLPVAERGQWVSSMEAHRHDSLWDACRRTVYFRKRKRKKGNVAGVWCERSEALQWCLIDPRPTRPTRTSLSFLPASKTLANYSLLF